MKIAVACGGTGGHILPGVVTAGELERRGHNVVLWLSGRDVEAVSAADWKGARRYVPGCGLPSGLSLRSFYALFILLRGVFQAYRIMRLDPPEVVLAMGSYAGAAPVLAARMLGIPVVLHESNAVPGRANLLLARFARCVGIHFSEAAAYFRQGRCVTVGFPLRPLESVPLDCTELEKDCFTLLVMGGSQGAVFLNDAVIGVLQRLKDAGKRIQTIHLCGKANESVVAEAYGKHGLRGLVRGFWPDMGAAYAACDMALCRAGAATCAELAATGTPALLVPLPSAMMNHQEANARALEKCGGVDVCRQTDLTVDYLFAYLSRFIDNAAALEIRAESLRNADGYAGAVRLADLVEQGA